MSQGVGEGHGTPGPNDGGEVNILLHARRAPLSFLAALLTQTLLVFTPYEALP